MSAAASEALVNGQRSYSDRGDLVRKALRARLMAESGDTYRWCWVVDMTPTDVVYEVDSDHLWQCPYTIDDAGEVTLGEPVQVARTYVAVGSPGGEPGESLTSAVESAQPGQRDHLVGRVLESKGTSSITGGRVYAVRIISVGDSLNGNRYGESVLAAAAPLYEGAKAYNRHRSTEDISSGTIEGLVGLYRNVEASAAGLDAELHLFPSATSTAEALDAALAAEAEGLPPTVGISHDVLGSFTSVTESGRSIRVAQSISHVFSADVVSQPAAGGKATRVVAGGIHLDHTPATHTRAAENQQESSMTAPSTEAVLAALKDATPDQLATVGLVRAGETTTAAATAPAADQGAAKEAAPAPAEVSYPKDSWAVRGMVQHVVGKAGLPEAVTEAVIEALPAEVTQSVVTAQLRVLQEGLALAERADLRPRTAETSVTQDERDRKRRALEDMFDTRDNTKGYPSLREAFSDWTGLRPRSFDEDFNRKVFESSFGGGRASESLDSGDWPKALADTMNKKMVAEYSLPELNSWEKVVSSQVRVNDFKDQKIIRVGGYGSLPEVEEGAPYQPLTSSTDEEVKYRISKRGGTEDFTMEMVANDDLKSLARIPTELGRAAAVTLYRFIWDLFTSNATVDYDSTPLFHADHANTTAVALSQSGLDSLRVKMRRQARANTPLDILSLVPRLLIVPPELEGLAKQLTTSAVAIPASGNASNIPNQHQGLGYEVVDYWSDPNDWFLLADPGKCPTIEVGFYQGQKLPQMFQQVDPNVGSVFDADKFTIKIRHIYGVTVVDHRGMQRGTA